MLLKKKSGESTSEVMGPLLKFSCPINENDKIK